MDQQRQASTSDGRMVAWWMVAMATGIVAVLLSGIGIFLPASGGSASEGTSSGAAGPRRSRWSWVSST